MIRSRATVCRAKRIGRIYSKLRRGTMIPSDRTSLKEQGYIVKYQMTGKKSKVGLCCRRAHNSVKKLRQGIKLRRGTPKELEIHLETQIWNINF
jgi:hypothetical protein